ncbi:MAG: transglutaminase domain-containing protein [Erysipelotrichaceae bacterium]|nr:transglutaminase domain-containing protein [Erysipelotrichaceae bacterium]
MKYLIAILLLLCGCSSGNAPDVPVKRPEDMGNKYEVPEFAEASFHEDLAIVDGKVMFDLSGVEEGYIAVSAVSDKRLKFQVTKEDVYYYDMKNDGTPSIFPLQSGDGRYVFRVCENIVESSYAYIAEASADVVMIDEFQPYLRRNDYVPYDRDSECVKLASRFAEESYSVFDVIDQVFRYVCKNVTYDKAKAESVQSGYLPDPDETLATGKGICFDYASLTASMLRSQGIPTKLIFGYVSPNDVYHAWNMIYTEEAGWIVAEFKVNENDWNRIDLTFSANGAESRFIGDGGNYTDVYQY